MEMIGSGSAASRTVVRCAGLTYVGRVESVRAEWESLRPVLMSFVVRVELVGLGNALDVQDRRIRFYVTVSDLAAWEQLVQRAGESAPIEAEAMVEVQDGSITAQGIALPAGELDLTTDEEGPHHGR